MSAFLTCFSAVHGVIPHLSVSRTKFHRLEVTTLSKCPLFMGSLHSCQERFQAWMGPWKRRVPPSFRNCARLHYAADPALSRSCAICWRNDRIWFQLGTPWDATPFHIHGPFRATARSPRRTRHEFPRCQSGRASEPRRPTRVERLKGYVTRKKPSTSAGATLPGVPDPAVVCLGILQHEAPLEEKTSVSTVQAAP
jgi:hypothetical protein